MKTVNFGTLEIGIIPRLLCSVVEPTSESTLVNAKRAMAAGADCIELRIDRLSSDREVPILLSQIDFPALVVCRPKHLDGYFTGPEEERTNRLLLALDHEPSAIDIEVTTPYKFRDRVIGKAKEKNVPLVITYENFNLTPSKEGMLSTYQTEISLGADVIKLAVMANSPLDTLKVLEVALEAKKFGIPYVAIAMGKHGSISRPLACVYGAAMTYCALERGKEGAPGQLTIKETRDLINLLSL